MKTKYLNGLRWNLLWFMFLIGGILYPLSAADSLRFFNLSHLDYLYQEIEVKQQKMAIIHIYAEYPDYRWKEAPGEGIACVDDVARAAVLYLKHYQLTGDQESLRKARNLLNFIFYMQDEDGLFYNFIFKDYSINRSGKTSKKGVNWWTARAVWAMGEAAVLFQSLDREYAGRLMKSIEKIYPHLDTLTTSYPKLEKYGGIQVPTWLIGGSAGDATGVLVMGLSKLYSISPSPRLKQYLEIFSKGLQFMQLGDETRFPFGAFLSYQNFWHGWGNSQSQALLSVYQVLKDSSYLKSARTEIRNFYPYVIKEGFPREMIFARKVSADSIYAKSISRFPQIAYAIRPMIMASMQLFRMEKDVFYARLAVQLATWFFGNNPARRIIYDPQTGRSYDGILSDSEINRNSGAESTIEALLSFLELESNPITAKLLEEEYRKYVRK